MPSAGARSGARSGALLDEAQASEATRMKPDCSAHSHARRGRAADASFRAPLGAPGPGRSSLSMASPAAQ